MHRMKMIFGLVCSTTRNIKIVVYKLQMYSKLRFTYIVC